MIFELNCTVHSMNEFAHFYGWFEGDLVIFLVMENRELGDLEKYITLALTSEDAKRITRQLLEGPKA